MNYFSDTPNPETQLSKDGSGAGFKVGKVKLHFEVHGLAFSIISECAINKHDPHSGYSVWTPLNQNICIEVAQILDTLVYSELPDDTIAALLPLHARSQGWKKNNSVTCVPEHKFRCLKVRGDNYSEECTDAVDAHHPCHQPKKGKAK